MTWTTEVYSPVEKPLLAQELYDTGLLAQINAAVLHPHGLAIGVDVQDGVVVGLTLHESSDPDGIWFNEELTIRARVKARTLGLLRRRRVYS